MKDEMTTLARFTVLLALLSVLVMPALATASTVTLTDYSGSNPHFFNDAAGGGGPFTATTTGLALGVEDFITFCLELNEEVSFNATYNFALSDGAVNGGVAGGNPDPLSDATKWLYYEVASGGYSSIYTAATGLGLSNDVGANFQYAFWFLEQERTESDLGGPSNPGVQLATYALANQNWSTLFAAGNRVFAMNLTDDAGSFHQDQLAYTSVNTTQDVPVPEPGSLMLLGTGLFVVSRKLRRKLKS